LKSFVAVVDDDVVNALSIVSEDKPQAKISPLAVQDFTSPT